MGVMACDRKGCENILCDRYSHVYGYICWQCFDELSLKPWMGIEEFMNSYKSEVDNNLRDLDSIFSL